MPRQDNRTVYGGVTVTRNEKEQLENQPVNEIINFTQKEEDSFAITHKLPEMIALLDGKSKVKAEVRFREAVNYYIKGYAKNSIDETGALDQIKYDKFYSRLNSLVSLPEANRKELKALLDIPEEDMDNFVNACQTEAFGMLNSLYGNQFDSLFDYQGWLERYESEKDTDPRLEEPLEKSYKDFQNGLNNFKKGLTIDPKTEKEFLIEVDCGSTACLYGAISKELNSYRSSQNLEKVSYSKTNIDMSKMPDDPEHNLFKAFYNHSTVTADITLKNERGEDVSKILSLETTAPAAPDLFFCPDSGFKGSGIYDVGENGDKYANLRNFHMGNNMVYCEDMDFIGNFKRISGKQVTRVTGSYKIEKDLLTKTNDYSDNYDELAQKIIANDSKWVRSSKEFRDMKEAFNALRNINDPEKRDLKIADLKAKAAAYIDYKDPKGDKKATAKLSDYAKARLDLGKEIYKYACGQYNQKETVRDEIRGSVLRSLAEEMKNSQASNTSRLGREILDNQETFKKYMGDIKNDSTLRSMFKGKTLSELRDMTNRPPTDLYRDFKETRLSNQKATSLAHQKAHSPEVKKANINPAPKVQDDVPQLK